MADREHTARDREIDRVDRRCENLDGLSGRFGNVVHFGERAYLAYYRGPQANVLARSFTPGSSPISNGPRRVPRGECHSAERL